MSHDLPSYIALKRKLHHYETDKDGVCHFSNYFRICEEAFSAVIHAECGDLTFAVVNATANYQKPLKAFDSFAVALRIVEMKRSSFQIQFSIQKNMTDNDSSFNPVSDVYALITLKYVMIDPLTWKAIPITSLIENLIKNILSQS